MLIADAAGTILTEKDDWYALRTDFGFTPDAKQYEVGDILFNHPRPRIIYVGSNTCGKSYGLAHLALRYFDKFDDAFIIITSTSQTQLKYQIWSKMKKSGRIVARKKGWRFLPEGMEVKTDDDTHRIIGYKPPASAEVSPEQSPFEGFHDFEGHILIIGDEARGLPTYIFEAMMAIDPHAIVLLSVPGNPSKHSSLYQEWTATRKDGSHLWTRINVSAYDSPWASAQWIQEMEDRWGRNHPIFKRRVLGQFAAWTEQGFFRWYNPDIKEHDDRYVQEAFHRVQKPAGHPRVLAVDVGATISLTWAIEFTGFKLSWLYAAPGGADMEVVAAVMKRHRANPISIIPIDAALGSGMISRFEELRAPVEGVRFSAGEAGTKNRMMGWARSAIERGDFDLRYHDGLDYDLWVDLKEQVLAFQEKELSSGAIRLEHAPGMRDDAVDTMVMCMAAILGKIRAVTQVRKRIPIGKIS